MIEKPHCRFLLLALSFGLAFAWLMPPFQIPDEMTHFFRSYQVAEGYLVSQRKVAMAGGEIPWGLWDPMRAYSYLQGNPNEKVRIDRKEYLRLLHLKLDRQNKAFMSFPNTVAYSPLCYLPQSLGIALGNRLNASALWLMY